MDSFLIALQTLVLIVLCVLIACMRSDLRRLQNEVRDLKRQPVSPPAQPRPAQARQPRPAPAPVPAPVWQPPVPVPPAPTAASPAPPVPPTPSPQAKSPRDSASVESVLGSRVLGILAALMVFAGLVFLAILVVPALSNEVRCAAMFVLSGALALAGMLVSRKGTTPFSQALLGCGMGSVFVSLMVTYVYFGYLGDVAALALMLAWLGVCTLLSLRYASVPLVVIAQVGMAISTCFAYARGLEAQQVPVVVAYQAMAAAIVVAGSTKALRKGRLAGIFCSLGVSLVVANLVTAFHGFGASAPEPTPYLAVMGSQMALVCVLALLGTLLEVRTHKDEDKASPRIAAHILLEAFWAIALWQDVLVASQVATRSLLGGVYAGLALVALHWAVRLVLAKTHLLNRSFLFASICTCAVCAMLLLAVRLPLPAAHAHVSAELVVFFCLLGTDLLCKDVRLRYGALAPLVADALLMAAFGYARLNELAPFPVGLLYVLLLVAALYLWWRLMPQDKRTSLAGPVLAAGLVGYELSVAASLSSLPHGLANVGTYAAALLPLSLLCLWNARERLSTSQGTRVVLAANEIAVVAFACADAVWKGPASYLKVAPAAPALCMGAALLSASIVAIEVVRMLQAPNAAQPWSQVANGILFSLWTCCLVHGLVAEGQGAVLTLCALCCAFVCIACGFLRGLGPLRLYGLVLSLLCVIRIVTVDVATASPAARVAAFIAGGLICFAISGVYTHATRKLAGTQKSRKSSKKPTR